VRTSVLFTQLLRLVEQVIVLLGQLNLVMVVSWVRCAIGSHRYLVLVPLDHIYVVHDISHIVVELFGDPLELQRQLIG
jgi:hypothetical protein